MGIYSLQATDVETGEGVGVEEWHDRLTDAIEEAFADAAHKADEIAALPSLEEADADAVQAHGFVFTLTHATGPVYRYVVRRFDMDMGDVTPNTCPACGEEVDYCSGHGALG